MKKKKNLKGQKKLPKDETIIGTTVGKQNLNQKRIKKLNKNGRKKK